MSAELKGCPFCGGEASLTIPSEHVQADCADIYVSCDECEVEGQRFVVEMKDRTSDLWPYEQRDAIAAWNTRAPADLRSALEAETIREAAGYAEEAREIAGMLAQSPDGPLRWKQYRLVAIADYLGSLTALAPTKEPAA